MSRQIIVYCAVILSLTWLCGCDRTQPQSGQAPIASGTLVSGTLWQRPIAGPGVTGSNSGNSPAKGSRVDIYDKFIIVTDAGGVSWGSLHGWYTELKFKAK